PDQPYDQPQQGRFSTAAGTDQHVGALRLEEQVDALQHRLGGIAFGDLREPDHRWQWQGRGRAAGLVFNRWPPNAARRSRLADRSNAGGGPARPARQVGRTPAPCTYESTP